MTGKKEQDPYELEPRPASDPEPQRPPAPSGQGPSSTARPPEVADEPDSIRALDICPNCGSTLPSIDAVVCLRCGFDFKTLKVIRTDTAGTVEPEVEPEEKPPLCGPGAGDLWLPWAMAGVSLGLLTVGYLAGAGGLIGDAGEEAVGFGVRLAGVLKMLVRTGLLALAGVAGLLLVAQILVAPLGNVKLAAVRMVGIFAAVSLLTFFNVQSNSLEWTIEAVCQAVAFVGLAMVLFQLSLRDAATLLGVTVCAVIGLLLTAALVMWSIPPG